MTRAGAARRRARVRRGGDVQGVGFRPYVYRLAPSSGSAGCVLQRRARRAARGRGRRRAVERLPRAAARGGAAAGGGRARARRSELAPTGERGFAIVASERGGEPRRARLARHRHLRRLPAGAVRPRRPPLPLPVHQLHELRAALHDRARRPLRPAAHHDGRLRDVRRAARPSTRTPPTAASTPSRTPAPTAGRRLRLADRDGRATAASRCRAAAAALARGRRSWRSRASAATTWPAAPTTRPRWPRCARASTARTSRSR